MTKSHKKRTLHLGELRSAEGGSERDEDSPGWYRTGLGMQPGSSMPQELPPSAPSGGWFPPVSWEFGSATSTGASTVLLPNTGDEISTGGHADYLHIAP